MSPLKLTDQKCIKFLRNWPTTINHLYFSQKSINCGSKFVFQSILYQNCFKPDKHPKSLWSSTLIFQHKQTYTRVREKTFGSWSGTWNYGYLFFLQEF